MMSIGRISRYEHDAPEQILGDVSLHSAHALHRCDLPNDRIPPSPCNEKRDQRPRRPTGGRRKAGDHPAPHVGGHGNERQRHPWCEHRIEDVEKQVEEQALCRMQINKALDGVRMSVYDEDRRDEAGADDPEPDIFLLRRDSHKLV